MAGFVLETNASSSSAFPHPTDDPDEKLRGAFGRMDGDKLFAFLLWEVPGDRTLDAVSPVRPSRSSVRLGGALHAPPGGDPR